MTIVFEDLPKLDKNHKMLRLTIGLGLVCLGFTQKPSGLFTFLSKCLGGIFIINSMTGWNPLNAMCDKPILNEESESKDQNSQDSEL